MSEDNNKPKLSRKSKKIYNPIKINTKDAFTTFGKVDGYNRHRVIKKDNIIYDLLN